jgi:3-dehydroquinate synthase
MTEVSLPLLPTTATTAADLRTIEVALGARSYRIDIGSGLLVKSLPMQLLSAATKIMLVSNATVFPLYGPTVLNGLARTGKPVLQLVLPDGEQFKDWQALDQIFDALLANACDRKTLLVALGGGVIGDVVGFAAATYQRGIAFIQLPTTLLAQVDSSVGGKTAVNHRLGKNMIGAFHQPKHVLIDTDVLASLPVREFRAGLAEVVKYGVALDREFFDWLEANVDAIVAREPNVTAFAIQRSCQLKANIVAKDEFETSREGGRALLNFGHTFGHAIEAALGYGTWLHGEAVACGMVLAAQLSAKQGYVGADVPQRLVELLSRIGLPTKLPQIPVESMLELMARDKKNEAGDIRLVVLGAIGQARVDASIHRDTIASVIAAN